MPRLIRLYIRSVALGFGLAAVFVGLLIGLNIAGLRHLIAATDGGATAVVMLVVFNGIVFAGVQFAYAVMQLAVPDDGPQGGCRVAVPVALAAGAKRREPRQP